MKTLFSTEATESSSENSNENDEEDGDGNDESGEITSGAEERAWRCGGVDGRLGA